MIAASALIALAHPPDAIRSKALEIASKRSLVGTFCLCDAGSIERNFLVSFTKVSSDSVFGIIIRRPLMSVNTGELPFASYCNEHYPQYNIR
jgi:hypothetical protein